MPTTENGYRYRDREYARLGTLSLLAGIDLLTGEATPLLSETHKSSDFIEFLRMLDAKYPKGEIIRLILDNHSAHKSKETKKIFAAAVLLPMLFVFAACTNSGNSALVGRWVSEDGGTMEFFKDGSGMAAGMAMAVSWSVENKRLIFTMTHHSALAQWYSIMK